MFRKGFRRGREPPSPRTQYERPIGPAMHRTGYRPPEPKSQPNSPHGPSQHRTYYNPPTHPVNSHRPVEEGPEIRPTTFQYGKEDMPYPRRPEYAEAQYAKNDLPNPRKTIGVRADRRYSDVKERFSNQGLVRRIREYHAKRNAPASAQEVAQLKLNAEREKHKSDLQFYKNSRKQQIGGPLIRGGGGYRSGGRQSGGYSRGGGGYSMGGGMGSFGFGSGSL